VTATTALSVIMPHYRCEDYLAASVRSILDQSWHDLELIVVDDASTSDTWLQALRPFRSDTRLKLYRTRENVGRYRINNRILELTSSPFVAFQDADDASDSSRLERQVRALERRRLDIVGTGFHVISESGEVLRKQRMPRWPLFRGVLGKDFVVHPATILCRRSVFDVLGGFDGTARFEADTDFLVRAQFAFRIGNVPRCLYFYRTRPGSLATSPDTGIGSPVREAYRRRMFERRDAFRAIPDPAALVSVLRAPPNDFPCDLEDVRL
jgi:glycosyltransferase involved in cell wall biosynthesis